MEFAFPLELHSVCYVIMYANAVQNFLCRPVGDELLTPFAERDAHQKHIDCHKRRLRFPRPILKVGGPERPFIPKHATAGRVRFSIFFPHQTCAAGTGLR